MKRLTALIATAIAALAIATAPASAGMSDGGDAPAPDCVYVWLPGSFQDAICK